MSFDYSEIAEVAREQITEFGQQVILRNHVDPTYDPNTGTSTPASAPVEHKRMAVIFDFARGQTMATDSLIEVGDKRAYMEVGVVPSTEDELIVGDITYRIISVNEVNPAGTPVLYDLQLRR